MAKSASEKKSGSDQKKAAKAAAGPAAGATVKIKLKSKKDGKKDGAKGSGSDKNAHKSEGFEGLAKLVDHPLVADLLAAGAIAAVTAIAEHQMGKGDSSSKMVKSVGKAAATAMGMRLISDLGAIGGAAAAAVKKA
jgi:hypothetical protein